MIPDTDEGFTLLKYHMREVLLMTEFLSEPGISTPSGANYFCGREREPIQQIQNQANPHPEKKGWKEYPEVSVLLLYDRGDCLYLYCNGCVKNIARQK